MLEKIGDKYKCYDDNKKYNFGDFEIEFLKTIHSTNVLSYAIKIKTKDKVIVYTGDCSYKSKNILIGLVILL